MSVALLHDALFAIRNDDRLLYMACISSSILLSQPLRLIKNTTMRHVYGTFFGLLFCLLNFGIYSTTYCVATSVAVWILVTYFQVKRWVVFTFAFVICSLAHMWIMYYDYLGWHMDFTGVQNILTLKFIMWSFDVNYYFEAKSAMKTTADMSAQDAINSASDVQAQIVVVGRSSSGATSASQFDKKVAFTDQPTLVEYMSHLFWFSNVLTMPIFSPQQHIQWVRRADVGGSFMPSLKAFLYALLFGAISAFVTSHHYFPMSSITNGDWQDWSIMTRLCYMWIAMMLSKLPYYIGWLMAESATIACGMGKEPSWIAPPGIKNVEKTPWVGASTVHIMGVELSRNFVEVTQAWNFSTSGWLRHYVYLRLDKKYATLVTFLVAAIWHGFYPGYYIAFICGSLHTEFGRLVFNRLDRFTNLSTLTTIGLIFINSFLTHYLFASFVLLGWRQCWTAYKDTWFAGHIMISVFILLLLLFKRKEMIHNGNNIKSA